MKFHAARQVIHDAFMNDVRGIDLSKMALEFGVQFSAKGPDNRIMDHCEKAVIQQALEIQKHNDKLGWAWNMFAYTPPGTQNGFERAELLQWMAEQYIHSGLGNPYVDHEGKILKLARVAMNDIAIQDRSGQRKRRRMVDMGNLLGVGPEEYEKQWHPHYNRLRGLCLQLPERSLPAISRIVFLMIRKRSEDHETALSATRDLQRALKMPVR